MKETHTYNPGPRGDQQTRWRGGESRSEQVKYLDCSSWRALLDEGGLGGGEIKESCLEKVAFEVSLKE